MAQRPELPGESPDTLTGPLEARFGVAPRRGFDEDGEIASEGGILGDGALAATAGPSNAQARDGVLELAETSCDGTAGDAGSAVDLGNAAPADQPGLGSEQEATLALVELG